MNRLNYSKVLLFVLGISEISSYSLKNSETTTIPAVVRKFYDEEMVYGIPIDFDPPWESSPLGAQRMKRDRPPSREEKNQRAYKADRMATLGIWTSEVDARIRALASQANATFRANCPRYIGMGLNFDQAVLWFATEFPALGPWLLENPHH